MKDYIKQHGDAILYAFIGGFAVSSLWAWISPPPLPVGASYLADHAEKFDMNDVVILHDGSLWASPTAIIFGYNGNLEWCQEYVKMILKEYPSRNEGYCELVEKRD